MKFKIVCVRDRAADVFGVPQFVVALGAAIRGFSDEVNRDAADNAFNRHPEDFDLFELGEYDDARATWETIEPRQIAIGKDLKIAKE